MTLPVLSTKLYAPPPTAGDIPRQRLFDLLHTGFNAARRLTLVSAPAGYGKTTLAAGWLAAESLPHAWLSLDEADNDPARFFTYLLLALRTLDPDLGADILPVLNLPQPPPLETLLVTLVNAVAAWPRPACLVLDDYHQVRAPRIHQMVQFLSERLPPLLHLVLLTREDPPLALARLRARRQLTELRTRDLCFTLDETTAFLARHTGLDLAPEQVRAVHARTEGWCAGVQMVALSLPNSPDIPAFIEAFSGTHRYIIDYLLEEVLAHLDEPARDFLTRTALLDRFCAPLCAAALDVPPEQAQAVLETFERANLFLIPLDDQRRWYRYHHLFADMLRAGLAPDVRRLVLRAAARWHANGGDPSEAVHCALEGEDFDLAVDLLHTAALAAARSGQVVTALRWLEALPRPLLIQSADLAAYRAWFLLFSGQVREALTWVETLENTLPPDTPGSIIGLLTGLKYWMKMAVGGHLDMPMLRRAVDLIDPHDGNFRPLILLAYGQSLQDPGRFAEAEACFREAAALAEANQDSLATVAVRNNLAFLLHLTGRLDEGLALCRQSLDQFTDASGQPSLIGRIACIPYGCLLSARGEDEAAREQLLRGISAVRQLGVYEIFAQPAETALIQLQADQGDLPGALEHTARLCLQAEKKGFGATTAACRAVEANLHLRAGRTDPAERWAAAVFPHPPGPVEVYDHTHLILARLWTVQGKYPQALDLLEQLAASVRRVGAVSEAVAVQVQLALTCQQAGRRGQAVAHLQEAVRLAAPQGYRRPFRAAADSLQPLLPAARAIAPAFVDSLLLPAAAPAHLVRAAQPLVEPLGERELEILALTAQGLSNQSISERLYITLGTVKWHLNNIYGKLGVKSRTQAIALARQLNLIP